jgi:hypothetical protein
MILDGLFYCLLRLNKHKTPALIYWSYNEKLFLYQNCHKDGKWNSSIEEANWSNNHSFLGADSYRTL